MPHCYKRIPYKQMQYMTLRLPPELYGLLKLAAIRANRSMNEEIIYLLDMEYANLNRPLNRALNTIHGMDE